MNGAWAAARAQLKKLLIDDAPIGWLVVVSGILVAGAAWLLASPEHIVSRKFTWDMLFNLEGAWHLYNGHVPHVDFHDPLGSLAFRLTEIGFRVTGPVVAGLIIGEIVGAAGLFAAATATVGRRLPFVPGIVLVLYACLLILAPSNVGENANDYTFANDYNSIGWAALVVLTLILFVPPRRDPTRGLLDVVTAGALIVALYYLKITYFMAALGELGIALLVSECLRPRRNAWIAVGAVALVNAVAPYNWPYLNDIWSAVATGAAQTSLFPLVSALLANIPELALMAMAAIVAISLWRSGSAPLRLPVAVYLSIAVAVAVLSQNSQFRGLPPSIAVAFLLYDHFRGDPSVGRRPAAAWVMLALLVFPIGETANMTASLAAYHRQTIRYKSFFVFERTALRGLAVPLEAPGLLDAIAHESDYDLFGRIRSVPTADGQAISQFEYAQTLLEAAELFEPPQRSSGGIVVLDMVNPLPFILGRPPPRGVTLWLDQRFPLLPADAMFGDVRYVLIPKFSTDQALTAMLKTHYGDYLAGHFRTLMETRSWTLLGRPDP